MKSGRLATWLALSALAHGVAVGGYVEYKQRPLRNLMASWFAKKDKLKETPAIRAKQSSDRSQKDKLKEEIRREREDLIYKARQQMRENKLELGEFVLQANYLDAKEEGNPFDLKEARGKYLALLDKLNSKLRKGQRVYNAIPEVLEGIDYFSSSKSMAHILFEGVGRCETLSHLVTALVYDSRYKKEAHLRTYSNHLAPIFRYHGREYDLSAGAFSDGRGVLLTAEHLIGMYCINGGFNYPDTEDSFKAIIPIFAKNAIKSFDPKRRLERSDPKKCVDEYHDFKLVLSPIHSLPSDWSSDNLHTTPIKPLSEEELGRMFTAIEYEKNCLQKTREKPDRLVRLSRLVAYYETARWNLRLHGRFSIAEVTENQKKTYLADAYELIDGEGADLLVKRFNKNHNLLHMVYLGRKGEDLLFKVVETAFAGSRGRVFKEVIKQSNLYGHDYQNALTALAMLVSNQSSKEKAIRFIEEHFSKTDVLVFMRVLHLVNLPFMRNEEFDMSGTIEFIRVFRAYEKIDKRYRPPQWHFIYRDPSMKPLRFDRLLEIMTEELGKAQLGKEWERAFLQYYTLSMLSPDPQDVREYDSAKNPEALEFLKALSGWLKQNPHSEYGEIEKIVDYIVAKGRYDVKTLKEARGIVGID